MKCPLMLKEWNPQPDIKKWQPMDCIMEECAWWEVYIGACSIRVLAAGIAQDTRDRERKASHDNG